MTAQGNFSRTGWAALVACAGLLGLAAIAPAAALAGSISGTVTDASTTNPIEGLEVCAYPLIEGEPVEEEWFCDDTGASGEYTIEDLEAGEYGVEFWGRPLNYVPQYFDGQSKWWQWDPVVVGTGAVTGIDAEMVKGGGIAGTVEAAAGGPVEFAFVCTWSIPGEEFGGCDETDSSGAYALKGMAEGSYEVEFSPERPDLLPQYYDHKAHWWEADSVSVTLGAVTTGIDADLLPAARVEGQVRRASDGAPLSDVEVCAWSIVDEFPIRCAYPGGDGRYSIGGLPADAYKVEFWPYDESLPIQYWDHKGTWAAADILSLSSGSLATGIDADLGAPPPVPAAIPPPSSTLPIIKPHRKRCKKGFRKKRVKGKVRCVKKKKRKHRRHAQARPGVPGGVVFRPVR